MSEYFVGQIVKSGSLGICDDCPTNNQYAVITNVDDPDYIQAVDADGNTHIVGGCWTISDKQAGDLNEDYYQPGMKVFAVNPKVIGAYFENGEVVEVVDRYAIDQFHVNINNTSGTLNTYHMFPIHPQQDTPKEYRVESIIIQLNGYINRVNVIYNQDSDTCLIHDNIFQNGVDLETLARLEILLNNHVQKSIEYGLFYTQIIYHTNMPSDNTTDIQKALQDFISDYLDNERIPF